MFECQIICHYDILKFVIDLTFGFRYLTFPYNTFYIMSTQILRATLLDAFFKLSTHSIPTPQLDAEILLAHILKKPKEFLYTHPEYNLAPSECTDFQKLIARRISREPVAYIINKKEFYDYEFYVDSRVLIPRPETEELVEQSLNLIAKLQQNQKIAIADIGTGSGCIIICLALELLKNRAQKSISFFAVDSSKNALEVALCNAKKHNIHKHINFSYGNLLEPILANKSFINADQHIIIANLPYVTTKIFETLEPEITKFEPREALLTPTDDPDYWYKKIKEQIKPLQTKIKWRTFFEKAI